GACRLLFSALAVDVGGLADAVVRPSRRPAADARVHARMRDAVARGSGAAAARGLDAVGSPRTIRPAEGAGKAETERNARGGGALRPGRARARRARASFSLGR